MKYYKNSSNDVYPFGDECFIDNLIINKTVMEKITNEKLVEISEAEALKILKIKKSKEESIQEINAKAQREILSEYPLWKQNNIQSDYAQYPDNKIFKVEFEKMRLFINQVRANADNEVLLLENS